MEFRIESDIQMIFYIYLWLDTKRLYYFLMISSHFLY